MTLQRRLLVLLLVAVPAIWIIAVTVAFTGARSEINELFDTEQVRLAQQVMALLPAEAGGAPLALKPPAQEPEAGGSAELEDMGIAVWSADGRFVVADREGRALPFRASPTGFATTTVAGKPWTVYYLVSADRDWVVAVGQAAYERNEVLRNLLAGQLLPWLLMLPVLVLAMVLVVRYALQPVHRLAREIESRGADDLEPVPTGGRPKELAPLVSSMNSLFARIGRTLEAERRFTADAAHELRTPLAAVRAQWEAARAAGDDATRETASRRVGEGLDRLNRVVAQLLALSSVDARGAAVFTQAIDWPRVVEDALSDCLPLIRARDAEVAVDWPAGGTAPLPLAGDAALLTLMVRNLVDNALRYGPANGEVRVAFTPDALVVEDSGPGLAPASLARVGDRFFRPAGQDEAGSGLGLSIARRVAELHGLELHVANRDDRAGLRVSVERTPG